MERTRFIHREPYLQGRKNALKENGGTGEPANNERYEITPPPSKAVAKDTIGHSTNHRPGNRPGNRPIGHSTIRQIDILENRSKEERQWTQIAFNS